MRTETTIEEQIGETVLAAAEALTVDELGSRAVEGLRRLVGASNILLYRYDELGRVHGVAGSLMEAVPTYAQELFQEDPIQKFLFEMTPTSPIISVDRSVDRKTFHRSAAYQDFYRPYEMDHLLGSWITPHAYGAPGMTGILMTRSRREGAFAGNTQGLLSAVLPAFQATARRAARIAAERAAQRREHEVMEAVIDATAATAARVAFDGRGRVLWASASAEQWLAPHLGHEDLLPSALVAAVIALSAAARGQSQGHGHGHGHGMTAAAETTISMTLDEGRVVQVELSLTRTGSGEAVVLATWCGLAAASPRSNGTRAARVAERRGLTRAETGVLELLAEGKSNREIAQRLFVSVETVKTHVQRILGKLGVESRTQAALVVTSM